MLVGGASLARVIGHEISDDLINMKMLCNVVLLKSILTQNISKKR